MVKGMEWLVGAILALIVAVAGFYYTKKDCCTDCSPQLFFMEFTGNSER